MYTLIITEKPTAAKAIAEALSEGRPKRNGEKHAWYEFSSNGRNFVVVPAVGHLFTLKQNSSGWDYPTFDVDWVPSFAASRFSKFSEPYFRNIEKLAKDADDFIIATDYDDEGEVIGYNVLRFICKRENAARMKFSTMTRAELAESFSNPLKMNKNLIESGLCRHYLDWYYGINLSRGLTRAIKLAAKRFRIISTGRVQGPVLHMLARHEKKIKAFKPKPFWQLEISVTAGQPLKAEYEEDRIWDKGAAEKIFSSIGKTATVNDIRKKLITQSPPKPYNTTSFLADIYRYFGYSPQHGMSIAESLYQAGLISYPRTSSEKLPADINYKKIISDLARQSKYSKDAKSLLGKELRPVEGNRTDQAHPAIYPTGEYKAIGAKQQKVYDLAVRRFLACFGGPAKRESQKVVLDVGTPSYFILSGKRTVEKGWLALYGRYAGREDVILPEMNKGDKLAVADRQMLSKETQPPPRFSQGSVLKEMEQKSLGTKSTRAQILQILYNRGYLVGKGIEVTELGMQLSDILEKNIPDVVSEKLTRHFEQECDEIESGQTSREMVLKEARTKLIKICNNFRKKELKVGKELTDAVIATQDRQSILGACRACGGTLRVHKNWRTGKRFAGCSGYSKGCRTGFPLPRLGMIMPAEKQCEECKTPIIHVRPEAGRPFRMCLDPLCKTKSEWLDMKKLKAAQHASIKASKDAEKNKCELCGKAMKSGRALTMHEKKCKGKALIDEKKAI